MDVRSFSYSATAKRYAEQVVAGEILACRWVQRACQRQLDDLAKFKGKASPYLFNPKLKDKDGRSFQPADNLCAFIERLPHVKGPLAGEPIQLEPWQVFILSAVFGWVKPNGTRRFRRSYIEVPRGNAKSTLSSAVALYMLAADREGGAEVYSLATTRDQARIVFGDAQAMARKSPGFRRRFSVEVGAHNMHVLASGSKFEALSAEGSTLDGLNIHFGCVDELHAHKTRTVYDVVETGTGKRDNSLLWVITTAGSNRAGICYEVRTFVTKLLDGVFADDTQFGIIYGLDDGDDWTSESALIKANPNWGISVRPEVLVPLQAKAMQLPSKKVPDGAMSTRKYKQIVSSINEVGLIEPLSVIQPDRKKPEYLVLDGHLRVLALKELGMSVGPCLFAKDDETFSYNHHINRLSTIAEHYMIRRAIDRGVSKERLARAFNVNLSSINRRINLLEGICPEAITLLQDKQFTPDVTRILRNMKAARQVEAVELMIASNTITVAHAEALLKATPPEQRTDVKPAEREKKTTPIEQIEKLEKEMSQVQDKYQEAESSYGSDLLNLVVAKGYLTKLLANGAVKSYIGRHEPEILSHLELVVNTVSMEEAVQQQQVAEA